MKVSVVSSRLGVPDISNILHGTCLTMTTYPGTNFVSFGYDPRRRRTLAIDQNGKVTQYAYDDADRLTSAAQNATSYDYDSLTAWHTSKNP